MLAAVDPAQPYGAALAWPRARPRVPAGRPAPTARTSSSSRPAALLYVERGGRSIVALARRGADETGVRARAAALRERGPRGARAEARAGAASTASRRWPSPVRDLLVELGFRQGRDA